MKTTSEKAPVNTGVNDVRWVSHIIIKGYIEIT